jgi:hypothetical protein
MCKSQHTNKRNMKRQENMTTLNFNNSTVINTNDSEVDEISDEEFK